MVQRTHIASLLDEPPRRLNSAPQCSTLMLEDDSHAYFVNIAEHQGLFRLIALLSLLQPCLCENDRLRISRLDKGNKGPLIV